jgi:hypothetical protein
MSQRNHQLLLVLGVIREPRQKYQRSPGPRAVLVCPPMSKMVKETVPLLPSKFFTSNRILISNYDVLCQSIGHALTWFMLANDGRAQVVGWPPIRSYRKNCLQPKKNDQVDGAGMYVKVSVDGAPYLRKIDLKVYKSYPELLKALENMFKLTIGKIICNSLPHKYENSTDNASLFIFF